MSNELKVGRINFSSAPSEVDLRPLAGPQPIHGRVRLTGEKIGVQRPSRGRAQEDIDRLFGHLNSERAQFERGVRELLSIRHGLAPNDYGDLRALGGHASQGLSAPSLAPATEFRDRSQSVEPSGLLGRLPPQNANQSAGIPSSRVSLKARFLRACRAFVNAWRAA